MNDEDRFATFTGGYAFFRMLAQVYCNECGAAFLCMGVVFHFSGCSKLKAPS